MKTIRTCGVVVALSILLLSLSGCGGSGDQPELGQVTGKITLDGNPLSGVAVVFQPDNGRPAHGRTDAEGKYELTYIRKTMGTKVGLNRVEIAPSEGAEDEEEEVAGEPEEDVDSPQVKRRAKSRKPSIPARYNTQSELERDVKPGKNTFDFELES